MLILTCNFLSNPQYQKIHYQKTICFCFHSHLVLLPFFYKSLWGLYCKACTSWDILRYKSESFSRPRVFSSKTAVCKKEFISIFLLNFSGGLYITISGANIFKSSYSTNTAKKTWVILRKNNKRKSMPEKLGCLLKIVEFIPSSSIQTDTDIIFIGNHVKHFG